jgi:hypothetical protein
MNDHSHICGKREHHGEEESEPMIKKEETKHHTTPEQAKALLDKMKEISDHIARVRHRFYYYISLLQQWHPRGCPSFSRLLFFQMN